MALAVERGAPRSPATHDGPAGWLVGSRSRGRRPRTAAASPLTAPRCDVNGPSRTDGALYCPPRVAPVQPGRRCKDCMAADAVCSHNPPSRWNAIQHCSGAGERTFGRSLLHKCNFISICGCLSTPITSSAPPASVEHLSVFWSHCITINVEEIEVGRVRG